MYDTLREKDEARPVSASGRARLDFYDLQTARAGVSHSPVMCTGELCEGDDVPHLGRAKQAVMECWGISEEIAR